MPKYEFDHIHLMSTDPDKTADFYVKMFGARLVKKAEISGGRFAIKLDLKGVPLLISPPRNPGDPVGLSHFGVRTDKLEEAVDEFKKKGVKFPVEITKVNPNLTISYLEAPEGVQIELQKGSV